MINILLLADRREIIAEIRNEENLLRKEESLKGFEIFKSRQKQFIMQKLREEFSEKTVENMRTVTSINLTKRVIKEQAAIYKEAPERIFQDATDNEKLQLENLYKLSKANQKFKKGNSYFKLLSQCAIQVVPRNGVIDMRILMPHHYDVIPWPRDSERAMVYVINLLDKSRLLDNIDQPEQKSKLQTDRSSTKPHRDGINQKIGDNEDFKAELERMVWWSDDFNFITNGNGNLIDPETDEKVKRLPKAKMKNTLGELPFVDVALMKDFEFWVREINNVVCFTEDFGVLLSDTSDINRLQGYSQAIITSKDKPGEFFLGPHRIMHLKQNPDPKVKDPKFEFATPNPNLNASLELLAVYLRLFLTSNDNDPSTITGKIEASKFNSGIERLLASIEKFESSKDDMDLFQDVEQEVFSLKVKWSNILQGVTKGPLVLNPKLRNGKISDKVELAVNFAEPSIIQTKVEKEDSDIKLIAADLKSKIEAIAEQRNITKDQALIVLSEIIEAKALEIRIMQQQALGQSGHKDENENKDKDKNTGHKDKDKK